MGSMGTKGTTGKGSAGGKARKYMEGNDRGMWGSRLEEGPGAGMLNRILEGEVQDKTRSTGKLKKVREEKEVWECGTRHKQSNNGWRGNRKESNNS